jgi:hypothetical protein
VLNRVGTETKVDGVRWSRRSVLLTGLLVAGCGGPKRPTIQGADDTSEEGGNKKRLREILDRRAAAVQQKDEGAFLADLDQSNEKLLQQEKVLFDNLRQFRFKEFRYITDKIFGGTEENGGYAFGPVIQLAQLTADDGPGGVAPAETFRYRLTRKGDKLVVSEITRATIDNSGQSGLSGPLADAPWHFGPMKVIQAGNVVLAADDSVSDLDRYAAAAEREARFVEGLWGNRLRFPGQVLFFTRDTDRLKKWYSFGAASQGGDFIASVLGLQRPMQGVRKDGSVYNGQYAGARIAVNLKSIARAKDDPASTVRHELVHAVTSRATTVTLLGEPAFGAPTWAIEGFARWTESIGNAAEAARARATAARLASGAKFNGRPPLTKTFYGKDISFNYDVSSTIFAYLEKSKGRDAAIEFYAQVITHVDGAGTFTDSPAFQGICERVVGRSSGAFLQQWAGFARGGA